MLRPPWWHRQATGRLASSSFIRTGTARIGIACISKPSAFTLAICHSWGFPHVQHQWPAMGCDRLEPVGQIPGMNLIDHRAFRSCPLRT
jgi:hypothetical protein